MAAIQKLVCGRRIIIPRRNFHVLRPVLPKWIELILFRFFDCWSLGFIILGYSRMLIFIFSNTSNYNVCFNWSMDDSIQRKFQWNYGRFTNLINLLYSFPYCSYVLQSNSLQSRRWVDNEWFDCLKGYSVINQLKFSILF